MSTVSIHAVGLSKRYQIGLRQEYQTLREALTTAASTPLRWLRSRRGEGSGAAGDGLVWALREVDLEVRDGEVVGIIGRNGSGKTTLLKLIAGITDPTAGYADVRGRIGSLLEVGVGFHKELTGRENIFLSGAILGMRRHETRRKFDEIVAFSEVERFLDTPVKRYSSGMYMRLAFAVAAHLDPEILVVDEVLAVGDAAFQKKCLGKMNDVARRGRTVLFVSHNMAAIEALCSKAVWLDGGRVRLTGPTDKVVLRYLEAAARTENVALPARTDRGGEGGVRLASVRIEAADGQPVIRNSSPLRITLGYEGDRPLHLPRFSLAVGDPRGVGLFQLDSKCTGELPEVLPPSGTVVCETAPILLTPGRCQVDVGIHRGNAVADSVECAAQFEVHPEDFYPTGRMPKRDRFIRVIGQSWAPADARP